MKQEQIVIHIEINSLKQTPNFLRTDPQREIHMPTIYIYITDSKTNRNKCVCINSRYMFNPTKININSTYMFAYMCPTEDGIKRIHY